MWPPSPLWGGEGGYNGAMREALKKNLKYYIFSKSFIVSVSYILSEYSFLGATKMPSSVKTHRFKELHQSNKNRLLKKISERQLLRKQKPMSRVRFSRIKKKLEKMP